MRRAGLMVAFAVSFAGITACGGSGDGGDAAPDNACELLTTEEAEDILGVPTGGASEDTDRSSGTYCEWVSEDSDDDGDAASDSGDGGPAYFISVEDDRGEEAVQDFESGKAEAESEGELEPIDGLGSDAYYQSPHGVEVRSGDRVFSTFVAGNDRHPLSDADSKRLELRAAKIVVERVGKPENEEAADAAAECARTRRCSGTRFRACDLLTDATVERITGFSIEEVDGLTAIPAGSSEAALCEYDLEETEQPTGGPLRRRLTVRFEPDAEEARREYRRVERDFSSGEGPDPEPLPEVADDAFYLEFNDVYVLTDAGLLTVSYEVDHPDGGADLSPPVKRAAIELTEEALTSLRR